jgi:hypothetical protein
MNSQHDFTADAVIKFRKEDMGDVWPVEETVKDEYEIVQMMALMPMSIAFKKNGIDHKALFYLDFFNEVAYNAEFEDLATVRPDLNEHILKILREKKNNAMPNIPTELAAKALNIKNKIFEGMPNAGKNQF